MKKVLFSIILLTTITACVRQKTNITVTKQAIIVEGPTK